MKKRWFILSIVFIILSSMAACGLTSDPTPNSPNDKLAEIMERGTIVVAVGDANRPRYAEINTEARLENTKCNPDQYTANQIDGFDPDSAKEIARHLDVELCFVTPDWALMTHGNWADRWDICVCSMAITEERMKHLYFTKPILSSGGELLVYDKDEFSKPQDLSGKRIGVAVDTIHELYLKKELTLPGQTITFLIDDPEIIGYKSLSSLVGANPTKEDLDLDAILITLSTNKNLGELQQLGEPLYYEHIGIGVDKSHSRNPISLLKELNTILQEMHDDGTLSKISKHYLEFDLTQKANQFDWADLEQIPSNASNK